MPHDWVLPAQSRRQFGDDFRSVCDRVIEMLGTADISVSVIIARIVGRAPSDIIERIERRIGDLGFVGVLSDGSVGVLHVGPRGAGAEATRAIEETVRFRLIREVVAASALDRPLRLVLQVLHTTTLRFRMDTAFFSHGGATAAPATP